MIVLILVVVVSIFEVRGMLKEKLKKELIIFSFISIMSLIIGIIYMRNPLKYSFSQAILNLLKQ